MTNKKRGIKNQAVILAWFDQIPSGDRCILYIKRAIHAGKDKTKLFYSSLFNTFVTRLELESMVL